MILGISLVKNEAGKDRWLSDFRYQMDILCDKVIILDDGSTDETPDYLESYGFEVIRSEYSLWETNELKQRKYLWNLAMNNSKENDWILNLDADELFVPKHLAYIKHLFAHANRYDVDSIGFKLYDMWTKDCYREDKWWTAHLRYWPMAVRKKNYKYEWPNKTLHCGRFPQNSAQKMLPTFIPIKHMGWNNEELRKQKYERYMRIDRDRKDGLIGQYESIIDKNPNLFKFYDGGTYENNFSLPS